MVQKRCIWGLFRGFCWPDVLFTYLKKKKYTPKSVPTCTCSVQHILYFFTAA